MRDDKIQKKQKDEKDVWYEAFVRKDARFDGYFFVGISSTGIYCRPVCRAKLPKRENITYYTSAAEAEAAGFRPCLLCRPELAPGCAETSVDAMTSLVLKATRLIEENCSFGESIEEIAERLGCSGRHLRRAFVAQLRVSPVQYLQTCRLLLAKNLLTNTNLSILEVAMAAGFNSLRRFNDLFKTRYRLVPTVFRKQVLGLKRLSGSITVELGYRPPYRWQQMLEFLHFRAIAGVEAIIGGEYHRVARLTKKDGTQICGCLKVCHKPRNNTLAVTVSDVLLPMLPQVLTRVRHMFDLYCEPETVYEALSSMNKIKPGLCVLGTRLPGCFDAFEMAVRAVLGQQITVKAARTLAGRFVKAYGTTIETGIDGLTHSFPFPSEIVSLRGNIGDHLGSLGITGMRAKTILGLAQTFAKGGIDFDCCSGTEAEVEKLMQIPGIGSWTAHYIAMRAMGWPDAFPSIDYGIKKALTPRSVKEILVLSENWRPWRSYAVINLWNSL